MKEEFNIKVSLNDILSVILTIAFIVVFYELSKALRNANKVNSNEIAVTGRELENLIDNAVAKSLKNQKSHE